MEQITDGEKQFMLEDFGVKTKLPRIPIQSASSDKIFNVCIVPGYEDCDPNHPCKHWIYRESKNRKFCSHINEAIRQELEKRVKYLENRRSFESQAWSTSFEMVMARLNGSTSEENRYIRALILSFANASGSVYSDDIYEAVGGEFMRNPSNIGTNFGILSKMHHIKQIGWRKSHRSIRHGGDQRVWTITETGKDICEGNA